MKCSIPEISWHNREPVLSVDIFPENKEFYRLASGGGDCHVLIWQMTIASNGVVNQEVISDLKRHQRAVNCVRWSHTGQYLASGDDDSNIIIWQLKTDNIPLLEGDTGDKEIWIVYKVLRGHKEDVYDLCWSVDESKLFSGSVDNTAILWDVHKGKMDHILTDHKGFVQGVSWDPKGQILASISTDRICRIFDIFGKQVKARIYKGKLSAVPENHFLRDKEVKFFHDDTFKSFFRRLQFSPDGSILVVPSGHMETENCKTVLNATLIFTLDNWTTPAVILPLPRQSSTVVRFCPILFELREEGPDPSIALPYRMIFAVGTDHDIILYDTQQTLPFARFQDIHYTRLTDLTWSHDGLLLIASSTDGFCSLITFELDELGVPYLKGDLEEEENPLEVSGCEELQDKDENVDINNKKENVEKIVKEIEDKPCKEKTVKTIKENHKDNTEKEEVKPEVKKRPSFLVQWALNTPKKKKNKPDETQPVKVKENQESVIEIIDSPEKKVTEKTNDTQTNSNNTGTTVNRIVPRRIAPIKVEDKCKQKQESVIEIVDSPEKKVTDTQSNLNNSETKNGTVNRITPKRIAPIKVEEKYLDNATQSKAETKINILTPRRIKPTLICASSKTESNPSCSKNC